MAGDVVVWLVLPGALQDAAACAARHAASTLSALPAGQVEVCGKHNLGSLSYQEAFERRPLAWAHFLRPSAEPAQRQYEEVTDWAKAHTLLQDHLATYNACHAAAPMDLGACVGPGAVLQSSQAGAALSIDSRR
jgi:hypothetical protein